MTRKDKKMKTAICPGSFDPITLGHIDIIKRASKLFDKVIVVVLPNPKKAPGFTMEERIDFIKRATADIPNVEVDFYDGLLADYCKIKNACCVVKGLRAVSDFEYEFQMALSNKKLNPDTETIFLNTSEQYLFLSSSIVKQVAKYGGDISHFVPSCILEDIKNRLLERKSSQ